LREEKKTLALSRLKQQEIFSIFEKKKTRCDAKKEMYFNI